MGLMIGEKNGYSTINYDCFAGEQESTNLTSRRDQGNAYEEPSSTVKKREEKMAKGLGETQSFDKKEEGENQNLHQSTGCTKVSIITCGFLILFILLTCALALLLSFQVLKKFQTSDSNSTQVIKEHEPTINDQKGVIDLQGGEINRLKNKISELAPEHTSVMLTGGWINSGITVSTAIYNSVEKNWTTCKLTLPHELANHGAAVLDNEIYIFGGYATGVADNPFNTVYKMGASNKWEEMAPMIEKRGAIPQSSLVFESEIWVIGGWNGTDALKSVEKYNPQTNSWTKMPELTVPRASVGAAVIDGKIYISSTSDGQKNSVEVYDPEKNKWEIFSTMPQEMHIHVLTANRSQLIVNGEWKMDVLDPKRKWEEMPSLQQKRGTTGAAQIADGLMVFGGAISLTQRIDSVEIFDGTKWNEGPKLPEVRGVFAYFPLTCAQERLFLKRYCS